MGSKKSAVKKAPIKKDTEGEEEEVVTVTIPRKGPVAADYIEATEPIIAEVAVEEKDDETAASAEEEADLASEESSLDEEELNPFGDKWEQ